MPNAIYEVTNQQTFVMGPSSSCPDQDGIITNAYPIDRYIPATINAGKSTDTQGGTSKLKVYIKAKDEELAPKQTLNYAFPELGCHYIDVYAEDTELKKTDIKRVWFLVSNAKPRIDRLDLSFPQQANSQTNSANGVNLAGSQQQGQAQAKLTITEMLNDEKIDNIIVKLQAQGVKDPDGFLSHIIWYYYRIESPEKLIEAKITPGSVQFVNFSIPKPRQPGEFGF
jgi:hypothetical protein